MRYFLQPAYISPHPRIEITSHEYEAIRCARAVLAAAFSIEEIYDLLIGNYFDIDSAALRIASSSVLRRRHDYADMFELKSEINRRAVNFLSTARLYVDQLPRKIRSCGIELKVAKSWLSAQYDAHAEYRFIEALRNHVQHSGLAVHAMQIHDKWIPPLERKRRELCLEITTLREHLEVDSDFKKVVLAECMERTNFLQYAHVYLECIGRVHSLTRESTERSISSSRATFETMINRYVEETGEKPIGLTVFPEEIATPNDRIPVFLNWDDVRIKLSKQNHDQVNLSCVVVASA